MAPDVKDPLKLIALDAEDLAVVSAHLQDSNAKVADMAYLPQEKRFAMLVDRFDWTSAGEGTAVRRRTGVHFDRVLKAQVRGFDLKDKEATLNLLAVEFAESDPPSGEVILLFSEDAAILLEIECLEAAMSDLGPSWPARERPRRDEG
ncbi:MAG: DUF2948 family protein [Xanthobacteraceae bacterium]